MVDKFSGIKAREKAKFKGREGSTSPGRKGSSGGIGEKEVIEP